MAGVYLPIFAIIITVLSSFKVFRTNTFRELIILYAVVNFPIIFFLRDEAEVYLVGYLSTLSMFYLIKRYIGKTYNTDTYIGLEGMVLTSPKLSLFVRLNLLMVANFPPFLNFGVVFNHLINDGFSFTTAYLLLVVFFNFAIFSKLTSRLLFGKPNKNIIYSDIGFKETILMGFLSLFNLIYGIYYLLNL